MCQISTKMTKGSEYTKKWKHPENKITVECAISTKSSIAFACYIYIANK